MIKVASIIGARPNFIKAALVSSALSKEKIKEILIHTGQHYDSSLSRNIFLNLKLREPDVNLNIQEESQLVQVGKMLVGLEKSLARIKPDLILIYGDTNSTLAGALVAAKLYIPIIHIEAGERTYRKNSPEETNRVICDHVSTINCCSTKNAMKNLAKEGLSKTIVFTGDLMYDLLKSQVNKLKKPKVNLPKQYILFTLHRFENTNNKGEIAKILKAINNINQSFVWPIHPRTKKIINKFNIKIPDNMISLEPVTYTEMIYLLKNATRVITDSGGIQKEAYWLGIPCITLANTTGWVKTRIGKWNQLTFTNYDAIKDLVKFKPTTKRDFGEFGDGKAVQNIVKTIKSYQKWTSLQ